MNDTNLSKYKKLFYEKRYGEIILELESSTIEKDRSPAILNLLGICRASLKGKTDRDVDYALKDFEAAFNKDNFGEISLDALCNHIKLCAEMGRKESDKVNNLVVSEKMYSDASKKFSNNERYLAHGIDLYKYLLKHKERISKLEELLKFKKLNKLFGTVYITSQMYLSNWRQRDFGDFQKKFSKVFSSFEVKKLSKIDTKKENIKIGFLSPDFCKSHSISYFVKNLIKDLKQTKFKSYGLSLLRVEEHDETTQIFKDLFDDWIDLGNKSDQDIVNIIQNLNIDILVDLAGLWSSNRISIFNTRICPLQISWLGFNNSSGLNEIDFILADENTVKEEEIEYGPKICKLPKIWNSHCGFENERLFNELPFNRNNYFTFGSLNNFMKINDEVLDVWIKILKKVKNSKIILKSSLYICEDVIKKRFEKEGLSKSLEILKKTKRNDFLSHLNTYNKIDLCLDTFPFNGVTTTFEALWKNVPVLTKKGYNFNSRCGESILKNANLSNFIAVNDEDYIEKASYYASSISVLNTIRKDLFNRINQTPLFDTKQFTNDFCWSLDQMIKEINKNYK